MLVLRLARGIRRYCVHRVARAGYTGGRALWLLEATRHSRLVLDLDVDGLARATVGVLGDVGPGGTAARLLSVLPVALSKCHGGAARC